MSMNVRVWAATAGLIVTQQLGGLGGTPARAPAPAAGSDVFGVSSTTFHVSALRVANGGGEASSRPDTIVGKRIRWTWSDGPVAGTTHEHLFRKDGTVEWRVIDGPQAGHTAVEDEYAVRRVAEEVFVVSHRASSGHTLTVVLNFADSTMVGFASNSEEWYPGSGTFAVLP